MSSWGAGGPKPPLQDVLAPRGHPHLGLPSFFFPRKMQDACFQVIKMQAGFTRTEDGALEGCRDAAAQDRGVCTGDVAANRGAGGLSTSA